jgi:hypothetical protein
MKTPEHAPMLPIAPAEMVELQDQLLEASTDLERLHGLLEDASRVLLDHFGSASAQLDRCGASAPTLEGLRQDLGGAMTALQFQDLASQIITHTVRRLQGVADFLGSRIDFPDEDSAQVNLVRRHCPVAQREIDAGSIELF